MPKMMLVMAVVSDQVVAIVAQWTFKVCELLPVARTQSALAELQNV